MNYKKDVRATYDNSFCVDSSCINYFEDNCFLCLNEEGCEVFPDSTICLKSRDSELCKEYSKGTNSAYLLTDEDIGEEQIIT